jgi:hypothetical protein
VEIPSHNDAQQSIDGISVDRTEFGFVKNTGWVGCVESQTECCKEMIDLDDEVGAFILQQVESYLDLINRSSFNSLRVTDGSIPIGTFP